MRRLRGILFAGTLSVITALGLAGCGGPDRTPKTPATDTSPTVSSPDNNNSYNNPSLADTAYEKNRTRPITDTMRKDTQTRRR